MTIASITGASVTVLGDIYQFSNAFEEAVSVNIHSDGANIGAVRRATWQPDGGEKRFISDDSHTTLTNIWDLSKHG